MKANIAPLKDKTTPPRKFTEAKSLLAIALALSLVLFFVGASIYWLIPNPYPPSLSGWPAATQGDALAFSPDNRLLASGGWKELKIWQIQPKRLLKRMVGVPAHVDIIAFSRNGRLVAASCNPHKGKNEEEIKKSDYWVRLWDTKSGDFKRAFRVEDVNMDLTFSADDRFLATASQYGDVKVWNVMTGKLVAHLKKHQGLVMTVAFSRDNKYLVSAGQDEKPVIWDTRNWKIYKVLGPTSDIVWAARFDTQQSALTVLCQNGTVETWDIKSGKKNFVIEDVEAVKAAALSIDAKTAVLGEYGSGLSHVSTGSMWLYKLPDTKKYEVDDKGDGYDSVVLSNDGKWLGLGYSSSNSDKEVAVLKLD